jgi:AGZA family xanthine/uracil permease-like MFS transporter
MISRFFKLESRGTTQFTEFQAGLTTFAAMAYILAVNPEILANTGMDKGALVTVTAITAAVATTLMALFTNYPIALAPGMGINAFFTFTIVLARGVPWSEALGMVFVNGIIFLALSVTGVREKIIASIPLGAKDCGHLRRRPLHRLHRPPARRRHHPERRDLRGPGDFTKGPAALCLAGIILTALLVARKVPGAIVLGILRSLSLAS